jgi:hypothetical protein
VILAFVAVSVFAVKLVVEALFNTVCPLTVRLVDDAFPSVEVPAVRVLTVPVVVTRLVVVAFVAVRLVNAAVRAERSEEK